MPSKTRKKKKDREFWPPKYYKGLTLRQKQIRKKEIEKFGAKDWKDPAAYRGFRSDAFIPTKSSSYTKEWKKQFPNALSLKDKAKVTGVPLKAIKASYDRGMAAWRTGHRPGATEQQWGYARVHSFLLCGKTYHTTDSDLARNAKATSVTARKWFKRCM
jgi:Family of unknown function (DUF5824)